nr:MAG TPA: hypothetical protein [Caudoviricetes sp.]
MKRKEILEIAIMLIAALLLIFACNNMNYIITMLRRPHQVYLGWDTRMISDYEKYYANKELAALAK